MTNEPIVHALWVGDDPLGPLEFMTMKSFVKHECKFNLWHYRKSKPRVPNGVILRDGNEILPESKLFRYPKDMLLGFGGGSYVGFSEIFRYKVLYELGGWWSDMDVTCLARLSEITDPYWFRFHGVLSVVGNIMKVPPQSELMKICYERASEVVNETQRDWHLAIRILCYHIENLGLGRYIHENECNLDRPNSIHPLLHIAGELDDIPESWKFIHWMNSVIRKNEYAQDSVFEKLLQAYDCQISRRIL